MSRGRLRRRWASAVLVAIAGLLLPAASAAAATWSEPLAVSPATEYAEEPAVAMDEQGDVAVVWRRSIDDYNSSIEASVKPAGGSFSAPIEVSTASGQNQEPAVALGPAGEVLVVWEGERGPGTAPGERIMSSSGSVAGGAFSEPKVIAQEPVSGGGRLLKVAIDTHGEALAVWQGYPEHMAYARRASGAQSFSAAVTIANPGLSVNRPGIAIASDGSAVVAWTGSIEKRTNGKSWTGAFAAVREAAGSFGPAQTLEAAPCMYGDTVDAAINDGGQAVVSWTAEKYECETGGNGVNASYRAPGQAFESPTNIPPQTLGTAGGDAVSPGGAVTVSGWGPGSLVALTRMPDGSYGDREVISTGQPFWDSTALATDAGGNLYAASDTREWVPGPEPGDDVPESSIVANFAPVGQGFAGESVLQTGYNDFDSMPEFATAGDGQAAVIWSAGTVASRRRAYVSVLQPQGPLPTPSPPPTPEATTPPPAPSEIDQAPSPAQDPPAPGHASGDSPVLAASPSATPQTSVLATSKRASGTTPRPAELVVHGRLSSPASAVEVRLLRGRKVLRAGRAHFAAGQFRALLSTAGLPRGRYRLQIVVRRGGRDALQQRWISLA